MSIESLLRASPPPTAWRHGPMTVADIDAHHDGARIWATVKAITEWAAGENEAGYERGVSDSEDLAEDAVEDAVEKARDECIDEVADMVSAIIAKHELTGELAESLRDMENRL